MPLPKISIVSPSYNQAVFLERNILSVLQQNYPNLQHIVIDGASTDGSVDILRKYPHLQWVSEPDRGQTHALNKGFRMADGEIVGWLNSDDTYCPAVFHEVAEAFSDPAVTVVCGDGYETDENDRVLKPMRSDRCSPEALIRYWKWDYAFVQPAFFFRRSVFDEVGYLDESLYYAMDLEFFIRLGKRYAFRYIPKPYANLRYYRSTKTGRNAEKFIPDYVWEFHKVSRKFWGRPWESVYYGYLSSFLGGIGLSLIRNILFLPGSKSRASISKS